MAVILTMTAGATAIGGKMNQPLPKPVKKELTGTRHHAVQASRATMELNMREGINKAEAVTVTPPTSLETERYVMNAYLYDGSKWEKVNRDLRIGFDGNDVYLQGMSVYLPDAWIKGTLSDDRATVNFAMQYYGSVQSYPIYFYPVTPSTADGETTYEVIDAVFNYNEDAGTLVLSQDQVCYIMENSSDTELAWYYQYDSEITIAPSGDTVEVPDGLETQEYALTGVYMGYEDDWFEGDPLVSSAKVGFDGDDIYVQGLCTYLPNAWVKGHRNGNSYVLDNGQFFGTFIYNNEAYPLYYVGCAPQSTDVAQLTLDADAETGVLTARQWYGISSSPDEVMWYDLLGNVVLSPIADEAATPATPEVLYYEYDTDEGYGYVMLSIPTTDADGMPLLSDKLGYQLFTDNGNGAEPYTFSADNYGFDEDQTTIAYNFADEINFMAHGELVVVYGMSEELQRIGVRSVYDGGGETNYSEVGWYNVGENEKVEITLPEGVTTDTYTLTALDLQFGEEWAEDYSADVQVGFDGNDVYIQGLSKWIPEAWVKGTLSDDGATATFPKHFLGLFTGWGIDMEFTFNGATFDYDAETSTFTSTEGYTSTSAYDIDGEHAEEDGDVFGNVVITKANEVAATPAAPEILNFALNEGYGYELNLYIPLEDVDGNPIFASKLSYQLFSMVGDEVNPIVLEADRYEFATEDMTIIPYLYTDYWEVTQGGETVFIYADGIENWKAIGAKTIYTGGGETHESPITWFETDSSGISTITAGDSVQQQYYDLMGRRVDSTSLKPGIYVTRNGNKVVVK